MKHNGRTYRVQTERDDTGAPWEEYDGYGVVSDWTTRAKRPGELVLSTDRTNRRYYDLTGTLAKARAERWGVSGGTTGMTAKQITAEAVRQDFEHLRGWANDEWCYVWIDVTDTATGERTSLGRVENRGGYVEQVVYELADELEQTRLNTVAETRQAVHTLNAKALPLLREIKRSRHAFAPAICDALRAQVMALLQQRARLFEVIAS